METTHKLLANGHCVPITTPDDYFEQSAREWLNKEKALNSVGKNVAREISEREKFPDPEMAGDDFLVFKGYKL